MAKDLDIRLIVKSGKKITEGLTIEYHVFVDGGDYGCSFGGDLTTAIMFAEQKYAQDRSTFVGIDRVVLNKHRRVYGTSSDWQSDDRYS